MYDEFLSNLENMDREDLETHFDNISKEKNSGRSLMLDPGLTDDQIRNYIKWLLEIEEPIEQEDEYPELTGPAPRVEGISDSVLKIIVAEGAALKAAGLLEQFELNYDAIEEAIHEEVLREGLSDDVYLPREEVIALIAEMDPEEVAGAEYIDEDSGEVLLAPGQKAGSSYVHPDYKRVKSPSKIPSWYAEEEDEEEDLQGQYQEAIEMYAADFAGESYDDPEGMAPDAAEGFFALHPEWKTWSVELGISKADMRSQIAELIHASLMGEGLQLEAEYRGRKVPLGKPMKGDTAKFKVYVKDKKTGNVKKVNFGAKGMEIRRDNPKARKSFRARHGCGTSRASDRTKAAWWSCRMWSTKPVSKILKGK